MVAADLAQHNSIRLLGRKLNGECELSGDQNEAKRQILDRDPFHSAYTSLR